MSVFVCYLNVIAFDVFFFTEWSQTETVERNNTVAIYLPFKANTDDFEATECK